MAGRLSVPDRRIWQFSFQDGRLWVTDHLNETYVLRPLSGDRFRIDPLPDATLNSKRLMATRTPR